MPTLTTKALILGLSSILGGTGIALGTEHVAEAAPMEHILPSTDAPKRSAEAHSRRDARAEARKTRHAERESLREDRRAARSAILADRPEPGEGRRGLTREAREAMRELARNTRRNGNPARRGPPAGRGMSSR